MTTSPARRVGAALRLVLAALVLAGVLAPGMASAYDRATRSGRSSCVDAPRAVGPMPASAVVASGRARSGARPATTGQGPRFGVMPLPARECGAVSSSVAPDPRPATGSFVRRRGPPSPTS